MSSFSVDQNGILIYNGALSQGSCYVIDQSSVSVVTSLVGVTSMIYYCISGGSYSSSLIPLNGQSAYLPQQSTNPPFRYVVRDGNNLTGTDDPAGYDQILVSVIDRIILTNNIDLAEGNTSLGNLTDLNNLMGLSLQISVPVTPGRSNINAAGDCIMVGQSSSGLLFAISQYTNLGAITPIGIGRLATAPSGSGTLWSANVRLINVTLLVPKTSLISSSDAFRSNLIADRTISGSDEKYGLSTTDTQPYEAGSLLAGIATRLPNDPNSVFITPITPIKLG